jgi:hypothetical protein
MSLQTYNPSGNWPDLDGTGTGGPLKMPQDGDPYLYEHHYQSTAPEQGLFGKIIDALDYLKKNAGASAVAAYSGTIWTIAAGSLETFLHALADKAAKVDATVTTFTGKFRVGSGAATPSAAGDAAISGVLTVGGQLNAQSTVSAAGLVSAGVGLELSNGLGAVAPFKMQNGSYRTRSRSAISTGATTATVTAAYPLWIADAWHDAGNSLVITVSDYAGSDNPEIEIVFRATNASDTCHIQRQGTGLDHVTINVKGSCVLRWDGSVWRCISGSAWTGTAADFTVTA